MSGVDGWPVAIRREWSPGRVRELIQKRKASKGAGDGNAKAQKNAESAKYRWDGDLPRDPALLG